MATNAELTNCFIDLSIQDRIVNYSEQTQCTADATIDRVAMWQRAGSFVVANAGGFDSMGLNHLRGLIQARIIGATYKLGEDASPSEIYELASSDEIRLLVSVDTNGAIEQNKSFKVQTALAIRPLLDWRTRARTLALQGMGGKRNLVDYITKHGPHACPVCENEGCNHSSKTFNIAASGADVVVLKSLNPETVTRYQETSFHEIDETEGAFHDDVLCGQISTSALIRRIQQERITL